MYIYVQYHSANVSYNTILNTVSYNTILHTYNAILHTYNIILQNVLYDTILRNVS